MYTLGHHGSKSSPVAALIWRRACSPDFGGAGYGNKSARRNGKYGFAELNHQRSEEK